jgi:hypothetical protein
MRRLCTALLSILLLCQAAGCSLFHNLQPHRLRMLNRGNPPSIDPDFLSRNESASAAVVVRAQQ